MTTGEDRNKDPYKNWKLCGLWKLPFRHHGALKLTESCVCFTNPCINPFVPTSVTREYHLKKLRRLNLLQIISAHLQTTLPWASWETQYLNLFSADFRSCLVARSRKPIKCELKTLLRRSTCAVPIHPQKANGSSCSSQQIHPCRRVCGCLYPIHIDLGSPDFLREGHISYCTTVQGPDILHNVFFQDLLHSTNSRQHIFQYTIFSLLAKCVLRQGEMASQVGCGPRAVVGELWYRLWRGMVTTHTIVGVQQLYSCNLNTSTRTQSSEQEYSYLTARKRHSSTPYFYNTLENHPKFFTRNPAIYFPKVDKSWIDVFGMLPRFLKNLLESGNLLCSATAATKTALGTTQLFQLFSRHLGIHSSWEAKQKDAAVVGLFTPVSLFLCMETNLLIIHYRFRMPCHLTHTSQPNRQAFQVPLIHYQTFRN